MDSEMTKQFENYKEAYLLIRDGIDLTIQDNDFIKKGGELIFAVDFSEIFSYVFPFDSFERFFIFPDTLVSEGEKVSAAALQQLVLNNIFFDLPTKRKLILLSPYLSEFTSFLKYLEDQTFDSLIDHAVQVFDDLEKIIAENLDDKISNIYNKLQEGFSISEEEQEILLQFVLKYSYIETIIEGDENEGDPFYRIKNLNPSNTFESLASIVKLSEIKTHQVYERWEKELIEKRHVENVSSARLDAMAMALMYEANSNLANNRRLLLITRSKTMHALMREEVKKDMWKVADNKNVLRHPMIFLLNFIATKGAEYGNVNVEGLNNLRETIDLFLVTYEKRGSYDVNVDRELMECIEKIKGTWREIQKTIFPLVKNFSQSGQESLHIEKAKQAKKILDYISTREAIKKRILERLDRLFYDLDRSHEILGWELQVSSDANDVSYFDSSSVLSGTMFPYKLKFYSESVEKMLNSLFVKQEVKFQDVLNVFRAGYERIEKTNEKEDDYEYILAMAYLLGFLEKWKIAISYCARAIKVGESVSVSTSEALYFLAVCKRRWKINKTIYLENMELLDRAINLVRENDGQRVEARYLIEKGLLILQYYRKYRARTVLDNAAITNGFELLEKGQDLVEVDIPTKLMIIRAKIDFYIARKNWKDLNSVKQEFKSLKNSLREANISPWPAYVIDVIAFGEWVLFHEENSSSEKREILISQLEQALKKERSFLGKHEIEIHLLEVKNDRNFLR